MNKKPQIKIFVTENKSKGLLPIFEYDSDNMKITVSMKPNAKK